MKYLLSLIVGMLLLAQVSRANNYAYIYIEGDKQTPFYVKMEGQMLPRLAKNYCIIPNLDAGVTYIEILFQQNKYPAQKFAVNIPSGGNRGFLLQKANDRQFALYDIQQGIHLVSGNKPEEDQIAALAPANDVVAATTQSPQTITSDDGSIPDFVPERKTKKTKVTKEPKHSETVKSEEGRFINDMELNSGGDKQPSSAIPEFEAKPIKKKTKKTKEEGSLAAITNDTGEPTEAIKPEVTEVVRATAANDCSDNITTEDFEDFAMKILDKTEDDAKIKVLSKGKGKKCFTTEQVRIIANNLDTQSGRYDVVKMLYAQTSDKENYARLENLFKTNYLKNKFKEILAGQ